MNALPTLFAAAGGTSLPDAAGSVARMFAALAFVLALFFGGVWLFRNWQRLSRLRRRTRLRVIEAQSLGPRQALYVVGYEQQRFMIAASPSGIALVTNLPEAIAAEDAAETTAAPASFALLLQNALGKK
jgi:flagellar biogenesis protein FliO